ncbi:hypothetical protein GZH47_24730 [Paenibacillus rhizovicinus]|uniref:Uncharacterized protein n=1 Tax=Paenibacillus rhizovicinus TaxID=2704463 RepID=A0A6C0P5F4_9BACL|nr:hypothetical protein [Paenibacillus rhizovicinus]QHW33685.1 hypothetical protein GZH47_24730 [Paenibacillus rhizovicinus]
MFYQIKPMLRQLKIEDESGYWLEFIEQASGNTAKELTEFSEVSEKDIVQHELLQLPVSASEIDQRYWNSNPKYMRPFMHIPTIRDRMGYDLMTGPYLLIAEEMGQLLRNEGFIVDSSDWQNDEFYLINLATWWAWTRSSGMKATALRRNKCQAFGWALARGCHGFHGGFLNQTHRRAHLAIDNLEQREGEASPLRSIQILYGLFAYVGLK